MDVLFGNPTNTLGRVIIIVISPFFRHNILLDSSLTPYVADFRFLMRPPLRYGSRCLVTSAGSFAFAGTRGYLAPEFVAGKIGSFIDVYSYGIVSVITNACIIMYMIVGSYNTCIYACL